MFRCILISEMYICINKYWGFNMVLCASGSDADVVGEVRKGFKRSPGKREVL